MQQPIAVIGAGHAGGELCAALRQQGYTGPLALIGEEPFAPYQRPPLSKAYLMGESERERLFLRADHYYAEQGIDMRLGVRVETIDRVARQLALSDGTTLAYSRLAITTGARPRPLPVPVSRSSRLHYLRTLADTDRLAPDLAPGGRLAVIGGGYIGLEIAASARKKGLEVTVVERLPRLLARVASAELSDDVLALHRAHGVDVRLDTEVEAIEGGESTAYTLRLGGGDDLAVDSVVVGIGVVPNQEVAKAAGLECGNGIIVDAQCRTSDPDIFAIGDVAEHPNRVYGRIRLESVQNAVEQAAVCAANLLGGEEVYDAVPWFWSDQFDARIQMAGLPAGYDQAVRRPGRRAGSHAVWLFREGRLIAVEAVSEGRSYMMGKRWLQAGCTPEAGPLADANVDLRELG